VTFRKVCPSHNGYPGYYAYEYESYWDKVKGKARQRMVRYLGPCSKDGKLLERPKSRFEGTTTFLSGGRVLAFYPAVMEFRLRELARRTLRVDGEVAGHFVELVLNQLSDGVADEHMPEWVQASPLPYLQSLSAEALTPETFEGVRSALCDLSPKTNTLVDHGIELQKALTGAWRSRTRERPGVYYDVTKVDYHGWANPLAEPGHDANGGISMVIGYGLVVSEREHHPYLCKPLPGSLHDSLSVADVVAMLQERGYRKLRLVMDRGMISKENVEWVRNAGYHLVGLVRGWDWETLALASRWNEEELEQPEHVVETSRGSVYARAQTTSLYGLPKVRVAVVVNPRWKQEAREARDLALLEWEKGNLTKEHIEELKRELKVQNPKLRAKKRYAPGLLVRSAGRRGAEVDREAVQRDRARDGRCLVFSTDLSLHGREMYGTYFARDAIEKVFRTGKGELHMEPVRKYRLDRMYASATVLYTAWLLWSWTERTLKRKLPKIGLTEALGLLEKVPWVRTGVGKSVREGVPRLSGKQEEVVTALGATRYLPVV
jgi:hypothetical protein